MYDDVELGKDIDSFMERIAQANAICYFHNLRFDGGFILDWLLRNGFLHTANQDLSEDRTFKTLISDKGMFYSITVRWDKGYSVEFRDSWKKLPMPVRVVAKSFNLAITKGEIEYTKEREIGYEPTAEEWDYLRRDVSIMAQALKQVHDNGMKKLTVASDSMAEYKRLTGADYFTKMFPILNEDMDMEIRRAYRGGFTYADPRYKGFVTRSGFVLDVNSLYPSVMKLRELPYGEPQYVEGFVEPSAARPLTIFSVTFTAKIKPDHIPCIQIKGSFIFAATEYLSEIPEPTTLMVTNVDWDLYNEHYDINVLAYGGGWRFRAVRGMFDSYIDKWSEVKAKETGGKRAIAKLHLNALYGKFASNPHIASKYPVMKDNMVKLVRGPDETRAPIYTAVGVFITSYARDLTIRAAQANYGSFAYADTDSLHLLQDDMPNDIEIHPSQLGAWKLEYKFDAAYYIRPKAYLERMYEDECDHDPEDIDKHGPWCKYVAHIAGLPYEPSRTLTFDDMIEGKQLKGKLNPKTVPGGVVLKDIPFTLKL